MEIKLIPEELQKTKLFIATPMYGGMCTGSFSRSMVDLSVLCTKYGIELNVHYLFNESLIQRARNYCASMFMRSNATHLMFIDADIGFNAQDILVMLALSTQDAAYDVLGGPYPKKAISWEKIKEAVDKGFADEEPENLANYIGDYVFNVVKPGPFYIDRPQEVFETGTGFMLITREAFEKFEKAYPEYEYTPDHARSEHFNGSEKIFAYFHCNIDPKSGRYLSEDYWFCQKLTEAGGRIWLCPWMQLTHTGSYVYGGSLQHLAQIGASASVDPSKLKVKKKK